MKIPAFWAMGRYAGENAQGKKFAFEAWGASDRSASEAQEAAVRRARRVFQIVAVEGRRPDEYDYADRPIREEILDRVMHEGNEAAIVTRNRYGVRVLNCASVLFADVDVTLPAPAGMAALFANLFGGREKREARRREAVQAAEQRVQTWSAQNPSRGFRLYRTCGGLRLLFTDKRYEPQAPETTRLLEELQSDPLYIRLTQKQACFRARLTAKPWRCGCARPPCRAYPWRQASDEQAFRTWQKKYEACEAKYRVCEFVGQFGAAGGDALVARIVESHDQETRKASTMPLA